MRFFDFAILLLSIVLDINTSSGSGIKSSLSVRLSSCHSFARNGKIVQVVNFINETYGRPVNEAKIYLSGNTVRVRTEAMSYSLGYCTTEFTYKYQKGTLLRTSNYGKYIKLNAANKRTGLFAAAKNIQAYTTPTSGSKAFVIRKNTGVKILNFWTAGNKMYIRVKNGSKTGWIKAVTFKESQGYAGSPQFSRVMYTGC